MKNKTDIIVVDRKGESVEILKKVKQVVGDRFVVYHLNEEEVEDQPWEETTELLVMVGGSREEAETGNTRSRREEKFGRFLDQGGNVLSVEHGRIQGPVSVENRGSVKRMSSSSDENISQVLRDILKLTKKRDISDATVLSPGYLSASTPSILSTFVENAKQSKKSHQPQKHNAFNLSLIHI